MAADMLPQEEDNGRQPQAEHSASHQHNHDAAITVRQSTSTNSTSNGTSSPPYPHDHSYSFSEGCESPHLSSPVQQACTTATVEGSADDRSRSSKAMRRQQEEMALRELEDKLRLLEVKKQVSERRCRQFVTMLEESMQGGEEVSWREGEDVRNQSAANGHRPRGGRGSDDCEWYIRKGLCFDQALAWRGTGR